MSRRPNPIPSKMLNLAVPMDLHAKLTAHLYSEVEGRVPLGAYQYLICNLLREYFSGGQLDLAPFVGSAPGSLILRGTKETVEALRLHLEKAPS